MKKLKKLCIVLMAAFIALTAVGAAAAAGEEAGRGGAGQFQLTYRQALDMALSNSYSLKNVGEDIDRSYEVRQNASDKVKYVPLGPGNEAANRAYTGLVQADLTWQMTKKNYESAKDSLAYTVRQSYNALLQAQGKKRLADLSVENEYWKNLLAELKYQVGMTSSIERSQARSGYNAARDSRQAAEKALEDSWQAFNRLVGLSLDSRPLLTDPPQMKAVGEIDLDAHAARVVSESPSVWLSEQQVNLAKLELDLFTFNNPSNPDTYQAKKIDVTKSMNSAAEVKDQLDKLVRSLYYSMRQLEDQHSTLQSSLEVAEQALKIARVRYEVGMAIKADLVAAELAVEQLRQQVSDIAAQHDSMKMAFEKPWAYGGGATGTSSRSR